VNTVTEFEMYMLICEYCDEFQMIEMCTLVCKHYD